MFLTLKEGTILYRGISNFTNHKKNSVLWLSEDLDTALLYGPKIIEYKLVKDLKLINLADLSFHEEYMNILNFIYCGSRNDRVDERKLEATIPLGLPNYETQVNYLLSKGVKLNKPQKWSDVHEMYSGFFMKRHRYSTYDRDERMVTHLEPIYGKNYNGYITKIAWPSKLHDGFFNREVCLFNPNHEVLTVNKTYGGAKKQKNPKNNNIPGDSWNRMNKTITVKRIDELKKELFKNSNFQEYLDMIDKE